MADLRLEGSGMGNPSEIIASLASDRNYDIITMGGRGLSYVQSVLIGSTTDAVIG